MDIYYNDHILYVNLVEMMDEGKMGLMKRRVFNILDDYDIDNIVLNIVGNNDLGLLLDGFIKEYYQKYNGKLTIK